LNDLSIDQQAHTARHGGFAAERLGESAVRGDELTVETNGKRQVKAVVDCLRQLIGQVQGFVQKIVFNAINEGIEGKASPVDALARFG
jgi:hypothetical protein